MRLLMALLLLGAALGVVSAITGIQSMHTEPNRTVITYWHGWDRLFALGYASLLALAFYGIYRRYPFVWRLGFVVLYLSAADSIFQVWWSFWPQPYGWVGAAVATVVIPLIALYWISWWRRQRPYFLGYGDEQT